MFGRKKKEELNPYESNDTIGLEQLQNNMNNMNNLIAPQVNQQQNQQIQQAQPVQQFQRAAVITKAEIDYAEGDYVYIVRTNYQLAVGRCQLVQ